MEATEAAERRPQPKSLGLTSHAPDWVCIASVATQYAVDSEYHVLLSLEKALELQSAENLLFEKGSIQKVCLPQ